MNTSNDNNPESTKDTTKYASLASPTRNPTVTSMPESRPIFCSPKTWLECRVKALGESEMSPATAMMIGMIGVTHPKAMEPTKKHSHDCTNQPTRNKISVTM